MRTLGSLKHAIFASFLTTAVMCTVYSDTANAQSTDEYLTSYVTALNARMPPSGDSATVAELFSQNGVQYHPFGEPGTQRGREALGKFFEGFKNSWADVTHIEKTRLVQGNHAVWEGTAEGHHKESGKYVRLPIVFFLNFDDEGKVQEARVYVDVHLVGDQIK